MQSFQLTATCRAVVEQGDLTLVDVDAIVNAANERMLGGGGVDGAIHRAAGPELKVACHGVAEMRPGVRCPTGEARLTPGFRLRARYIIHTVGPVYRSAEQAAPLLASAYRSSLELATDHKLRTIAFPAISCGVYRYPLDEAAAVAWQTCRQYAGSLEEIRFVLFSEDVRDAWLAAAPA